MKPGWKTAKFKDVSTVVGGSTPKTDIPEYWGGDNYWVAPAELDGSKYISSTVKRITDLAISKTNLTLLPRGTVLLSSRAPIGKVAITTVPMYCNQGFKNIVCGPELFNGYVYYFLKHNVDYLQSLGTGATFKEISKKVVENVSVSYPSIEEQQRIVDELDLLTGIIDKKNAQLRDLDAYAQSLFYEMFGDPVINDKGWPQKKLNTVCDVRDGTHDSPKYLTYSDYILVTSKNIVGDSIDYSNINYISKEDYDAINKRSKVDEGDIIMAMIGTIGKPVIVHKEGYNFCVKNVALIKFQANSEVTNVYIRALLNSPSYSDYILSLNKGGTQKFVALGTLRSLPIPVPPMHVLEDFSIRISSIEKQSHLIRESIAELNQLLSCKMSQLFTQG